MGLLFGTICCSSAAFAVYGVAFVAPASCSFAALLLCCCCCGCFQVADRWNANLCPLFDLPKCFCSLFCYLCCCVAVVSICAAVCTTCCCLCGLLFVCCCCSFFLLALFCFFCCLFCFCCRYWEKPPLKTPPLPHLTFQEIFALFLLLCLCCFCHELLLFEVDFLSCAVFSCCSCCFCCRFCGLLLFMALLLLLLLPVLLLLCCFVAAAAGAFRSPTVETPIFARFLTFQNVFCCLFCCLCCCVAAVCTTCCCLLLLVRLVVVAAFLFACTVTLFLLFVSLLLPLWGR